jgi:hypothetical protein
MRKRWFVLDYLTIDDVFRMMNTMLALTGCDWPWTITKATMK